MSELQTVTMIGLGNMGSALASAIAETGHDLTVWNRSDAKCRTLAAQGASVALSVGEAVSRSDVIGDIRFLGADPTASAVINTSALAFVYVAAHAFVSAAAMCDASGAPLDLLADVIGKFTTQMSPMFEEYIDMIAARSYESTSLRLASGAENLEAIAEFGRTSGVNTDLFESVLRTLNASSAAGHGTNLASVFEAVKRQHG